MVLATQLVVLGSGSPGKGTAAESMAVQAVPPQVKSWESCVTSSSLAPLCLSLLPHEMGIVVLFPHGVREDYNKLMNARRVNERLAMPQRHVRSYYLRSVYTSLLNHRVSLHAAHHAKMPCLSGLCSLNICKTRAWRTLKRLSSGFV